FENVGPQAGGTALNSTSAGSLTPTPILSCTLTGATLSFTTYSLITVRCSGAMTTVSAGPTPTVCASACALMSMASPLTAINARFIVPLRILRAGSPGGERAVQDPVPRRICRALSSRSSPLPNACSVRWTFRSHHRMSANDPKRTARPFQHDRLNRYDARPGAGYAATQFPHTTRQCGHLAVGKPRAAAGAYAARCSADAHGRGRSGRTDPLGSIPSGLAGGRLGRRRQCPVDIRWAAADADRFRSYTAELIGLAPDVVLASSSQSVVAFQKATSTLPIVFAAVVDPVAQGFVDNIARP